MGEGVVGMGRKMGLPDTRKIIQRGKKIMAYYIFQTLNSIWELSKLLRRTIQMSLLHIFQLHTFVLSRFCRDVYLLLQSFTTYFS